jgi:dTDP-4-dehydrorhamnose reductase
MSKRKIFKNCQFENQVMQTKVLIVGASSKTALTTIGVLSSQTDWEIHAISSKQLKLDEKINQYKCSALEFKSIREISNSIKPDFIINFVAQTNVDGCETDKMLAYELNVKVVENLIRAAKISQSTIIHLSTDYVFDGKNGPYSENDLPSPINYYGKTKLAAENACIVSNLPYSIIRTNVVYGVSDGLKKDFIEWVLENCDQGKEINVVSDQYGNPTLADDIAIAMMKIISKKRTGIYHIGGKDYVSRFEFAVKIAEHFHVDSSLIKKIETSELHQKANRPMRGGLLTLKAETDLGIKLAGIESGLQTYRHQKAQKEKGEH